MSIKQLQQLENIELSNIVLPASGPTHPNGHQLSGNGTVLGNYLFEGSKFTGYENEANSYYHSFQMDGLTLSVLLLQDVWKQMKEIDRACMNSPILKAAYSSRRPPEMG